MQNRIWSKMYWINRTKTDCKCEFNAITSIHLHDDRFIDTDEKEWLVDKRKSMHSILLCTVICGTVRRMDEKKSQEKMLFEATKEFITQYKPIMIVKKNTEQTYFTNQRACQMLRAFKVLQLNDTKLTIDWSFNFKLGEINLR